MTPNGPSPDEQVPAALPAAAPAASSAPLGGPRFPATPEGLEAFLRAVAAQATVAGLERGARLRLTSACAALVQPAAPGATPASVAFALTLEPEGRAALHLDGVDPETADLELAARLVDRLVEGPGCIDLALATPPATFDEEPGALADRDWLTPADCAALRGDATTDPEELRHAPPALASVIGRLLAPADPIHAFQA